MKKHHDFHGNTDSVPARGNERAVPNKHWEKNFPVNFTKDAKGLAGSDWNPKLSKHRTKTYIKINDEDH